MSNMEVINAVKHYQRNIEKCAGDVQRMLHCLQKLYRLPVTVQHLQETGVGRTVNALRKYEGDTGEAAKALVNKWKAMVAEAESSGEDVPNEKHRTRTESPPPRSSSHKHKSSRSDSHREETHSEKNKSVHRNHSSSSHSDNKNEKLSNKSKHYDQGHKRHHEEENRQTEEKRRRRNVVEEDEEEEEEEDEEEEEQEVPDSGHESHEELENNESDNVSIADSNRSESKEEEGEEEDEENEIASETEEVQQGNSDSSSDVEHVPEVEVKHKSHSGKHSETKQRSYHNANITHSNHNSQNSRSHSDGYHKSREKSNSSDLKYSKKTEGKNDSSSKTGSKSNSGHSKEDKSKIKEKERNREKERSKEREKAKERVKSEMKNKEDTKKKLKEDKRDEKSKNIPKQEPKPSTSSSKGSSSKTENKSKNSNAKKVKVSTEGTEDGIDSCSGTSFADALGMMGMMDNVTKKKKKVSSSSNTAKKAEGPSGSQASNSASSSRKPKDVTPRNSSHLKIPTSPEDLNLLDPSAKLVPLDELDMEVDVDATLPTINPNYRPLPHFNLDMPSRARARSLTEEEALSQVMSTKNQRTKVYSGVKSSKSWATVPSLFDICVRVLQENIDALEYTGGVPYDLLKPVLLHATPEQLFALEHYNPYLIEDTDELWESHVRRKFRNERRLDMETHREMFQRCTEESAAKLKALTLNIQKAMEKSVPVRQTKLAYVDSIAKPPRQVARKQAKFGTANATATTPMAKVQKLAGPTTSSANRSNSPVVHAPTPRTSHSAKAKPRMAPLMQKTMKLAKSFKR